MSKWQAAPISPQVLTHSYSKAYNCTTCIFLHGFDAYLQVHLILVPWITLLKLNNVMFSDQVKRKIMCFGCDAGS